MKPYPTSAGAEKVEARLCPNWSTEIRVITFCIKALTESCGISSCLVIQNAKGTNLNQSKHLMHEPALLFSRLRMYRRVCWTAITQRTEVPYSKRNKVQQSLRSSESEIEVSYIEKSHQNMKHCYVETGSKYNSGEAALKNVTTTKTKE